MSPALPDSISEHGLSQEELRELWASLVMELMDPKYYGRTHPNRRTADAGCKGPLCRKAVREHSRRRRAADANERYKYIDAILEYWQPIAVERINEEQVAVFKKLVAS